MTDSEKHDRILSFTLDAPAAAPDAPGVRVLRDQAGKQVIAFSGDWTLETGGFAERKLELQPGVPVALVCNDIRNWDSRFLAAVLEIQTALAAEKMEPDLSGIPDGARKMLDSMLKTTLTRKEQPPAETNFRTRIAEILHFAEIREICTFVGEILVGLWYFLRRKSTTRSRDVMEQIYRTGPTALAIISLISFLMGLILAFIGSIPLKFFSAEIFIASLLGIGILRLMAPVMVGIVMAGRTGASFAAELGSMVVNEELDAMKTFGIPTFEFLVIPRCVAMMLMLPLLGVFADLVGVLGGMLVGIFYMDLGTEEFFQQLIETTSLSDLFVGLFTCWVFGFLIAACGCYQGMQCGRNAEAVGRATTTAVVSSIVCIVIATALITLLTVNLKI